MPHENWRGQFAMGTWGVGAVGSSGSLRGKRSDCPYGGAPDCIPLAWPGFSTNAWGKTSAQGGTTGDPTYWMGSLVNGMRDRTGQQYMRNRYYDPATGQFTQPDPIGLAGGLNAYGFAAGDPVTYSDPYGLSGCNWLRDPLECAARALQSQMAARGHNLTMTETRYYVRHPFTMAVAASVVKETGSFVAEMEAAYPDRPGVGNAARHQYGQCAMSLAVGQAAAKKTGDLHEAENAPDNADSRVDQENNVRGRAIAAEYPQTSRRDVEAAGQRQRHCARGVLENIESGNYSWVNQ